MANLLQYLRGKILDAISETANSSVVPFEEILKKAGYFKPLQAAAFFRTDVVNSLEIFPNLALVELRNGQILLLGQYTTHEYVGELPDDPYAAYERAMSVVGSRK
jgi:hypothetical protein